MHAMLHGPTLALVAKSLEPVEVLQLRQASATLQCALREQLRLSVQSKFFCLDCEAFWTPYFGGEWCHECQRPGIRFRPRRRIRTKRAPFPQCLHRLWSILNTSFKFHDSDLSDWY